MPREQHVVLLALACLWPAQVNADELKNYIDEQGFVVDQPTYYKATHPGTDEYTPPNLDSTTYGVMAPGSVSEKPIRNGGFDLGFPKGSPGWFGDAKLPRTSTAGLDLYVTEHTGVDDRLVSLWVLNGATGAEALGQLDDDCNNINELSEEQKHEYASQLTEEQKIEHGLKGYGNN